MSELQVLWVLTSETQPCAGLFDFWLKTQIFDFDFWLKASLVWGPAVLDWAILPTSQVLWCAAGLMEDSWAAIVTWSNSPPKSLSSPFYVYISCPSLEKPWFKETGWLNYKYFWHSSFIRSNNSLFFIMKLKGHADITIFVAQCSSLPLEYVTCIQESMCWLTWWRLYTSLLCGQL